MPRECDFHVEAGRARPSDQDGPRRRSGRPSRAWRPSWAPGPATRSCSRCAPPSCWPGPTWCSPAPRCRPARGTCCPAGAAGPRPGRSGRRPAAAGQGGQGRPAGGGGLFAGDPLLFGPAAGQRRRVRQGPGPVRDRAGHARRHRGARLRGHPADRRHRRRYPDRARIRRQPPSARPSRPRSLVILGAEAGPVDIAKMLMAAGLAGAHPVHHHLERDHHRAATIGVSAGVGRPPTSRRPG